MAKKNLKLTRTDENFERLLEEKRMAVNVEFREKLRKPVTAPDTQRLARIFWGGQVYQAMFGKDEKRGLNKKGSVFDVLFISVFFFISVVSIVVLTMTWNTLYDNVEFTTDTGQEVADIFEEQMKPQFQYILLGAYMGALIITIILAYLIKVHRIFMVVAFIFTLATFLVSSVLSNVYEEATSTGVLADTATESFGVVGFVIDKYPLFYIVFSLLVIFALVVSDEVG